MTTWLERRAELEAALSATERPIDPPYAMVWGSGSDLRMNGAGAAPFRFRVTCVSSYADDDAGASSRLALYVAGVLEILVGMSGWAIDSLGPDETRSIAGGTYLTADIAVSSWATLS